MKGGTKPDKAANFTLNNKRTTAAFYYPPDCELPPVDKNKAPFRFPIDDYVWLTEMVLVSDQSVEDFINTRRLSVDKPPSSPTIDWTGGDD